MRFLTFGPLRWFPLLAIFCIGSAAFLGARSAHADCSYVPGVGATLSCWSAGRCEEVAYCHRYNCDGGGGDCGENSGENCYVGLLCPPPGGHCDIAFCE